MGTARTQLEQLLGDGALIVEMTDACTVSVVTHDGQRRLFASNDEDLLATVTPCMSARLE